jgi:hypothetical protein
MRAASQRCDRVPRRNRAPRDQLGSVAAKHRAPEFVPYGICVNTVSPGSILVEGNGWDRYRLANPEYFEDYVRHGFPMGRLGTAQEVADVIVFAASPRAHWINGRNIPVDGLEQPHAPLDPLSVLASPAPFGAALQEMTGILLHKDSRRTSAKNQPARRRRERKMQRSKSARLCFLSGLAFLSGFGPLGRSKYLTWRSPASPEQISQWTGDLKLIERV